MKNDPSASPLDGPAVALSGNAWTRFWFTPIPSTGLRLMRILAGVLFLFWLMSLLGHQESFFSLQGWLDREAVVALQKPQEGMLPAQFGWSIFYLAGESPESFQALYWGAIAILVLFTLGVATRLTGVLTWVIVVSFLANSITGYEADYLLGILAFYLMIGYVLVGQWNGNLSPLERIIGAHDDFVFYRWIVPSRQPRPLSYAANFTMRLLQIHLAIIMVTSGFHKLQMADWWSGVAFWYPLHPPFRTTLDGLNRDRLHSISLLFVLSLAEYIVLAWQICFPVFAWRKGWWRIVLLGGAAVYWLGVLFLFQLPLFGPFVFLGCLSYLGPTEWAWIENRFRGLLGTKSAGDPIATTKKMSVLMGKQHLQK